VSSTDRHSEPAVAYRCHTCGWQFHWTSETTTPAAVVRHQTDNPTHRRYDLELTTTP
jgi:hypothetical protein